MSLHFTVTTCDGCRDTGFLSVTEKIVVEKKNKQEEQSSPLVAFAVLRSDHRHRPSTGSTRSRGRSCPRPDPAALIWA